MDLFVTRFIPVDVAETVDRTISEVMTRAYTASLAMVRRNFAAIEACVRGRLVEFVGREVCVRVCVSPPSCAVVSASRHPLHSRTKSRMRCLTLWPDE